ncbi:TPA: hypothetical protein ACTUT5_000424 [Legionella anisa]|uniref:hypothetical protein n=1 Tax=Legionella anisa TaxID=28082 RepID=UPI0019802E0A|nr:hypothetical protein [Legionella anisa]MBN5934685.1 hypothetical protein [Legionella anisa]
MPGYSLLGSVVFRYLFKETTGAIEHNVSDLGITLENRDNVVIVRDSIPVGSLNALFKYLATRKDLAQKHILLGVEGQGVTEQHIVTMHLPPNGANPIVYDSKHGDSKRFFSLPPSKNTFGNKIRSALRALNPNTDQTVDLSHLGCEQIKSATYHSFGTQSFFDGITCGYHTGNLIKTLADLLEQGMNPSPEQLVEASRNPITTSAQLVKETFPERVDMSILAFLKKAWQDTFLPLKKNEEKSQYHFGHYFMGWPSKPNGSKLAYFLTLKFLTTPLTNLLSLVTEFPLNLLSQTFSFLKNKILSWAPTHGVTQGIRSFSLLLTMGLQHLFKGASYLIRTITSPLASYKAAQKAHPVLGYLSALASVLFIGAIIATLAVFAPPIVAAIIPSMGPGALSLLGTLAYPFVQLFSLASVTIPAATGAVLTLATGASFLGALHLLGRKTIYPEESQSQKDDKNSYESNVIILDDDEEVEEILHKKEEYGKDPHIKGSSDMLNNHFGKMPKKITSDDFNPEVNQDTMSNEF